MRDAIEECKELGRESFLKKYGYLPPLLRGLRPAARPSCGFVLLFSGKKRGARMDASRLYAILSDIRSEFDSLSTSSLLQQLIATLNQVAAAPAEPSHVISYKTAREAMIQALSEAPSNHMAPTKRMLLVQVGGDSYVGNGLLDRVDNALRENLLSPQSAATEIQRINKETTKFMEMIASVVTSLTTLNIDSDSLEPGQVELGFSLPKLDETAGLRNLVSDLKKFDEALRAFAQITGADLDASQLKRIASNDWQFFIDSVPQIGACVALCVERVVALYKTLMEIRRLKKDAETNKMPAEILDSIQLQIDSRIKEGLDAAAKELVEKFGDKEKHHGRELPEMEILARSALVYIATKIDAGATLEVTVVPPNAPIAPSDPDDAEAQREYQALLEKHAQISITYENIRESGKSMLNLTLQPQPILHLTDASEAQPPEPTEKAA